MHYFIFLIFNLSAFSFNSVKCETEKKKFNLELVQVVSKQVFNEHLLTIISKFQCKNIK